MAPVQLDVNNLSVVSIPQNNISDPVLRLANCLSGPNTTTQDDESRAAVARILLNLRQKRSRLYEDLHQHFHPSLNPWDRVAHACCEVVCLIRENPRQSIDQLLERLQKLSVMVPSSGPRLVVLSTKCFFHVSVLNAAALKAVGVRLVWVDSLTTHLHLDPEIPALYLFRSPSYCILQASETAFLSLFSAVFYDDGELADMADFSIPRLMDEVLSSYALLFRHDDRARRLFWKRERGSAATEDYDGKAVFDPQLDKACGYSSRSPFFSRWNEPSRETYHVAQFPLFQQRLKTLQFFMDGIQPNRIRSIWRDRRDPRLWWTFWTVVMFGCATLVLAVVSIGLSVWQGVMTQRGLDLAILQSVLVGGQQPQPQVSSVLGKGSQFDRMQYHLY
ncbi:hypothetical protein C8A00DRAFT_30965 [Chaetomidium leptoderma]|uniref:Uncharacterized protein n=1 Tax=Chaetomidium leptoderma TaxID=669021 RepID=A0AAN6VQX2_9PEZI|nr:hypothetical protein C8A00DRAFT_30965 [Chaetomidium leptoderma]